MSNLLKIILIVLAGLTVVTVGMLGVRGQTSVRRPLQIWDDMVDQPKWKPQQTTTLFPDGRTDRAAPKGTVAWGRNTLAANADLAVADRDLFGMERLPLEVDRALLLRGREVFTIYCTACHGQTGVGNGITTQYGMTNPPTFHSDRLRNVTDGYIYQVITEGKGLMGPYGGSIHRKDRWAAIAYLRTLQRAFNAPPSDIPASELAAISPMAAPTTMPATTAPATTAPAAGGAK